MRIICPTCASHYDVEADKIGATGQLVRCAECREVWMVHAPSADALPASPPPAARAKRDPNAFAAAFEAHRQTVERPIDFAAAKARLRRGNGAPDGARARAGSIALLSLGALCATTLGVLVTYRTAVVTAMPSTAPTFAALGLPVNAAGLALRDVHSVVTAEGNKTILSLEGEIANLRDGPTAVPNLTVVVRDDAQTPLYTWTTTAPVKRLAKGETIAFRSRLAAPPTDGRDVRVSFADASVVGPVKP